jgi:hypothetical protein
MRMQRPLLTAIAIWLAVDVAHTIWHVAHGDSPGTLIAQLAIDAALAFAAASALWLPGRLRRPLGGSAALLIGAFSIARGISGTVSAEGGAWIHILLLLSGIPLALAGAWILIDRNISRPQAARQATPRA